MPAAVPPSAAERSLDEQAQEELNRIMNQKRKLDAVYGNELATNDDNDNELDDIHDDINPLHNNDDYSDEEDGNQDHSNEDDNADPPVNVLHANHVDEDEGDGGSGRMSASEFRQRKAGSGAAANRQRAVGGRAAGGRAAGGQSRMNTGDMSSSRMNTGMHGMNGRSQPPGAGQGGKKIVNPENLEEIQNMMRALGAGSKNMLSKQQQLRKGLEKKGPAEKTTEEKGEGIHRERYIRAIHSVHRERYIV
jgi:hypothetical protein